MIISSAPYFSPLLVSQSPPKICFLKFVQIFSYSYWSYHLLVIFHPSWYLSLLLIFAFSNLYKYFQLTFPTTLYIFPYSLNIMQECAKNISYHIFGNLNRPTKYRILEKNQWFELYFIVQACAQSCEKVLHLWKFTVWETMKIIPKDFWSFLYLA